MKNCKLNDNCKIVIKHIYKEYEEDNRPDFFGFDKEYIESIPIEISEDEDKISVIDSIISYLQQKDFVERFSQRGYTLTKYGINCAEDDDLLDNIFIS